MSFRVVVGAEEIRLSLSGFSESESWPLRRVTRALGTRTVFVSLDRLMMFR
jgi:hypothetical protein